MATNAQFCSRDKDWSSPACYEQEQAGSQEMGERQPAPEGCLPLILWSLQDELKALKEGFLYAWSSSNRYSLHF